MKDGQTIKAPHILWHDKTVNISATEAMQAEDGGKSSSSALDTAMAFLREFLAGGPRSRVDIDDAADGNGVAQRTLFRAKGELGVIAKKVGLGGGWTWELPEQGPGDHSSER